MLFDDRPRFFLSVFLRFGKKILAALFLRVVFSFGCADDDGADEVAEAVVRRGALKVTQSALGIILSICSRNASLLVFLLRFAYSISPKLSWDIFYSPLTGG